MLAALAAAVAFACTDGQPPLSPDADRAAGSYALGLRPHFSLLGGGPAQSLPFNRLRLVARDSASTAELGRHEDDIDPAASSWTVGLEIRLPPGVYDVVVLVTIELIHAVGGSEEVQWSGITPGIRVAVGATHIEDTPVELYPGPPENLLVTAISIHGAAPLLEGDTLRLNAAATTSQPAAPRVIWRTLDPDVAAVDDAGLVRGLAAGTARIEAVAGPRADTAELAVGPRPTSVRLTPPTATVHSLGAEVQFDAVVLDGRGAAIPGAGVLWRGTGSAAEHLGNGRVRARENGSWTLTALAAGDTTVAAVATLTVQQTVAAVTVAPDIVHFDTPGDNAQLGADVRDGNGNMVHGAAVEWSSDDATVAAVTPNGLVTAGGPGQATISARSGSVTGTAIVTVARRPASVHVEPAAIALDAVGATSVATAHVLAADGAVLDLPITWSSSDAAVATVTADGVVTARRDGTAIVTATHANLTAGVAVEVRQVARTLSVDPATVTLAAGQSSALTATARDSRGQDISSGLVWTSDNTAVATVAADGIVRGVAAGTARIAVRRDDVAAMASVVVTTPNLVAIQLTLTPDPVAEGGVLTAEVTVGSDGAVAAPATTALVRLRDAETDAVVAQRTVVVPALESGATHTARADFTVDPAIPWPARVQAVAMVDPDEVVAETTRADNEVESASVEVLLAVARLVAEPASVEFPAIGTVARVTVTVLDRHDRPMQRTVTWRSDDAEVVRVSGDGVLTAVAPGATDVTASASGVSVVIPVLVREPSVAHLLLSPRNLRFTAVGRTAAVTAELRDAQGGVLPLPELTWTSTDAAVAAVDQHGTVTALAAGTARIAATAGGLADSVDVVVEQVPAQLVSVSGVTTVALGGTLALQARDSAGVDIPPALLDWSVTPADAGTVDDTGRFHPAAEGTVEVRAALGAAAAALELTVRVPNLVLVSLDLPAAVVAGTPFTGSARLRNDGSTATPAALMTIRFRAAGTVLGEVTQQRPAVPPRDAIDVTITATVPADSPWPATVVVELVAGPGIAPAEASVAVRYPVQALTVVPAAVTLDRVGAAQQLAVTAADAFGRPVTGAPVTFVSTDAGVATVDENGLVTAVGTGTAGINVSADAATTAVPVTVASSPDIAAIVVVSGGGQTGTVGQPLPEPITVEVRDSDGNAVPDALLVWELDGWVAAGAAAQGVFAAARASVAADGAAEGAAVAVPGAGPPTGSLSADTVRTDASGRATIAWQLGHRAGRHRAAVRTADGAASAALLAQARPGPPRRAHPRSGGLTAVVTPGLTDVVELQIFDEFDNPVPDATVLWQVVGGGPHSVLPGGGSTATTTTDAEGVTSLEWSLSTQAGLHRLRISIDGTPVALDIEKRTTPAALRRLNLTPRSVVLTGIGHAAEFRVDPEDEYGNGIADGVELRWSSSDTTVVQAAATNPGRGRGVGRKNGEATVTVRGSTSDASVEETAHVTVAQRAGGNGIAIAGDTLVVAGSSITLTASGLDTNNHPINQFRWSVPDGGGAWLEIVGSDRQPTVTLRGRETAEPREVVVRVTDPPGLAAATIRITVLPQP